MTSRPQPDDVLVEKAARSVSELQSNVNNLADVLVFLEVLGYTDADAKAASALDLNELAARVYQRVDYYDRGDASSSLDDRVVKVPTVKRRLIESLGLATPWLGGLALLYAFGVSLWLAWGLPLGSVTALMVGVLLGLLISEGPLQAFTRVFMFYHAQGNVSECARALKRSYLAIALLLTASLSVMLLCSYLLEIPWELTGLAAVAATTISLHRIGYLPIFALKKVKTIVFSYALAFGLLAVTFESSGGLVPDPVIRYLVSLTAAQGVLSTFAWYHSKKSLVIETHALLGKDAPSFFKPIFLNPHSIRSRFSVQFWEALPQYLYGTFFFILIFGDRVLSWMGNPVKEVGGVVLPFVFNSVYHTGADLALAVLFPVAVIQYVMLSSVHEELHNLSLELRVTMTDRVDRFISERYSRLLQVSVAAAAATGALMVAFVSNGISPAAWSPLSMKIMYVAVMANILLTIFIVNSSFLLLLNKPKPLATITMAGAVVVGAVGIYLLPLGFEYLIFAYVAACGSVACLSTAYLGGLMRSPSGFFFSRFV